MQTHVGNIKKYDFSEFVFFFLLIFSVYTVL